MVGGALLALYACMRFVAQLARRLRCGGLRRHCGVARAAVAVRCVLPLRHAAAAVAARHVLPLRHAELALLRAIH